jgi:acetyl-CoA synthetase
MSEIIPVFPHIAERAVITPTRYSALLTHANHDVESFWREQGQRLRWIKPYTTVKNTSFEAADVHIRWFEDGVLNVSENCLDRHLPKRADQIAILWEGDDPSESRSLTYAQLYEHVCRCANVLKDLGVQAGDTVTIYLPMIPEAAVAMLACARIGAVHSVVFGGFSADALAGRIVDAKSRVVITADEGLRAGKKVPLKANVDTALTHCPSVEHVLVVARTNADVPRTARDLDWETSLKAAATTYAPTPMNAEAPLFILYTSGSTGTPKGVVHTSGGYLVYASLTHEWVFDLREGDVYWCTADVGWVTGHSYVVYGPLSNGATTLMFEGVPTYPSVSRCWEIIDKYKVTQFYTAPTAIRALMQHCDEPLKSTTRASLRVLGSVGEPINPEAWRWYFEVVGNSQCPIVDTWWQTETGGHLISPLVGVTALKPGSATKPLFGISAALVDANGQVLEGEAEGNLVITDSWPGQMRTLYGDHERFVQTYFSAYPGMYFTGDGARRDADGDYWITGRVDDVINISGHRMGTAEIESALVAHEAICEAAVVGMPHAVKGQGIYAYVTLMDGVDASEALRAELVVFVRQAIGAIATPDVIHFAPNLPKTRSGKIMRRILRKIAEGQKDGFGDVSTLADPSVMEQLLKGR